MFQLTSHSIVQFVSLIVYAILISSILYSKRVRLKKLFSLFLVAAAGMSLVSLLMNLRLPYEQIVFWKMLVPLFATWAVVTYAHFITAFTDRDTSNVVRVGYVWLAVAFTIAAFGYFTQGLSLLENDIATAFFGRLVDSLVFVNALIAATMVYFLVISLKSASDPEARNRSAYLLAGLGFMMLAIIIGYIVQDKNNTASIIGNTINAVLITYILLRYRLLDVQVVVKKWMVYTGVTVCVTVAYLALLLGLSNMLRLLPPQLGIPATIIMVILFAYFFNWVKAALDKFADRILYGNRYIHRQMLLNFAGKMSKFINMKELASALVGPLAKAIRAKQVGLLLPTQDHYTAKYVASLAYDEQIEPLTLRKDSPLIRWLAEYGIPLIRETVDINPDFRKLSKEDRDALDESQTELLCPIISKGKLLGILSSSKKQPHGNYSRDDIDLVTMLARESAVAIENAQIYASVKEKANTDELTGLCNHRYFQECLNAQIEACSRSSDDFALLFIDLDFFKTYNDIYGHILGDEILRDFGRLISSSIRDTDIGARYGGDEFAAILLHSSVDGAVAVAERIRQRWEDQMQKKGITLTCSIGVACWRLDGVIRGKIIHEADKALYRAKQAGGNQVCVAGKSDDIELELPETASKPDNVIAVDNIVYALAATVDARDHYTYGHSKMVAKYATEIAEVIGYSKEGIQRIRSAALLHDIGKLNLPDSILTKRDPLNDEEWEIIKHHPEMGVSILKYIVGLRGCIDAVLFHHERYDGLGYPRGLKGNDIPMDARIMSISDSFDAMTSERGYKKRSMTEEEALQELENCAGSQFDPELVEVFIGIRRKSQMMDSALERVLYNGTR